MSDLKKQVEEVEGIIYGPNCRSSKGNEYVKVVLENGDVIEFYGDDWIDELKENSGYYEGLECEIFYNGDDRLFGEVIVPSSELKAAELLDRKKPEDFEGLDEEKKEKILKQVEKIFEKRRGNQSGLDNYEA